MEKTLNVLFFNYRSSILQKEILIVLLQVYDMRTKQLLWELYGHTDTIFDVNIVNNTIVSAGADRKIRVCRGQILF